MEGVENDVLDNQFCGGASQREGEAREPAYFFVIIMLGS